MKAAVLGSPIQHSKSPLLHMAAYAALGLPWAYDRHDVDASRLPAFLDEHHGEYRGLSLTMPLKDVAFELADVHDAASLATRACNTLLCDDALSGFNTDVVGFMNALRYRGVNSLQSATILGTGATARSAAVALLRMEVPQLTVIGRRAEAGIDFASWYSELGGRIAPRLWDEPLSVVDLTISTTPAGATDARPVPSPPGILFDVVYAPWPTPYAARWAAAGGTVMSGLDLLVHQAAEQVILMTGVASSQRDRIVDAMYQALAAG